jgi:hypothetical protein
LIVVQSTPFEISDDRSSPPGPKTNSASPRRPAISGSELASVPRASARSVRKLAVTVFPTARSAV